MIPEGRHIIRKAYLDVTAGDVEAFAFQNQAVAWAQDHLLPALDALFASLPHTEAHIILDRLEINLEAGDPSGWGEKVLAQLRSDLYQALHRTLQDPAPAAGKETLSPSQAFFRKLAFFLQHGVLPWNAAAGPTLAAADWAAQVDRWLDLEESPRYAPALTALWRQPSSRLRFRQSLPPRVAEKALIRLFHFPEAKAKAWAQDAARLTLPIPAAAESLETPRLPPALLDEVLLALSHSPRILVQGLDEDIVRAYLEKILAENPQPSARLKAMAFQTPAFQASRDRILRATGTPPSRRGTADPRQAASSASSPEAAQGMGQTTPAPHPDLPGLEDPSREGVHITNAGVVLLAPFLTLLFDRLELLARPSAKDPAKEGEAHKDEAKKPALRDPGTALAVLHYLATAQDNPVDFELPLAKILCGIPWEKAISLPVALAPAVKEEADTLLTSMVGHWSVLKDTSIGSLRESFLQRPGKLTRRPQGDWLLQVEQRSFDMLLQHLPWSFQIIRLPWMSQVLYTEWVA